jgi:hypothetical protein
MDKAGIHSATRSRIVGDLIFLNEGGKVSQRAVWPMADKLRLPQRPLPAIYKLGEAFDDAFAYIASKAAEIDHLREVYLQSNG